MVEKPRYQSPSRHDDLIDAYMADLRRALRHKDRQQAAEIESAVREHIDMALDGPIVGDDQINRVLAELGSAEKIGDAATGEGEQTRLWTSYIGPVGLVLAAMVALTLSGFWFVGIPLGLAAGLTGIGLARRSSDRIAILYRVSAAIGALAVVVAALVAVFLVSWTSS